MTFVALATVLALAACATPADAQSPAVDSLLPVGARVDFRTWRTNSSVPAMSYRVIGTVLAHEGGEFQVRDARTGGVVTVATRQLARLNVSLGRKRHTVLGAMIGFGAGMLAGYVVGLTCQGYDCDNRPSAQTARAQRGSGIGTVVGTVVGGTVGYLINTDQWRTVIAPSRTVLRITPGAGRTTLTVSHPF